MSTPDASATSSPAPSPSSPSIIRDNSLLLSPFRPGVENRSLLIARRIGLDCLSGILAAFTAAPIIMAVDKAVVQSTADASISILSSLKSTMTQFIRNPIQFVNTREFRWIFFVYGSTYMAANSVDSLCKIYQIDDVLPKLFGVTAINMTASVLKDRAYAQYFGNSSAKPSPVGAIPLLIWFFRDILTVANAFILPDRMSGALVKTKLVDNEASAKKITTFTFPVISQFALTPLHLLGYDIYNRAGKVVADRIAYLKPKYLPSVGVRMIRMGAAYGIGGVNNRGFRDYFISRFEGEEWDKNYKLKV